MTEISICSVLAKMCILFNASTTMDNCYHAEVNYDMSHPVQPKKTGRDYDFEELEKMVLVNQ